MAAATSTVTIIKMKEPKEWDGHPLNYIDLVRELDGTANKRRKVSLKKNSVSSSTVTYQQKGSSLNTSLNKNRSFDIPGIKHYEYFVHRNRHKHDNVSPTRSRGSTPAHLPSYQNKQVARNTSIVEEEMLAELDNSMSIEELKSQLSKTRSILRASRSKNRKYAEQLEVFILVLSYVQEQGDKKELLIKNLQKELQKQRELAKSLAEEKEESSSLNQKLSAKLRKLKEKLNQQKEYFLEKLKSNEEDKKPKLSGIDLEPADKETKSTLDAIKIQALKNAEQTQDTKISNYQTLTAAAVVESDSDNELRARIHSVVGNMERKAGDDEILLEKARKHIEVVEKDSKAAVQLDKEEYKEETPKASESSTNLEDSSKQNNPSEESVNIRRSGNMEKLVARKSIYFPTALNCPKCEKRILMRNSVLSSQCSCGYVIGRSNNSIASASTSSSLNLLSLKNLPRLQEQQTPVILVERSPSPVNEQKDQGNEQSQDQTETITTTSNIVPTITLNLDVEPEKFPEYVKCPNCKRSFELRDGLQFSMCSCGYVHTNSSRKTPRSPHEAVSKSLSADNVSLDPEKSKLLRKQRRLIRKESSRKLKELSELLAASVPVDNDLLSPITPSSSAEYGELSPSDAASSNSMSLPSSPEIPLPPPPPPIVATPKSEKPNIEKDFAKVEAMTSSMSFLDDIKKIQVDSEHRLQAIQNAHDQIKVNRENRVDAMHSIFSEIRKVKPDSDNRLKALRSAEVVSVSNKINC